ncbi:MAG: hypothetical protein AAGD92_14095 [Pseudomonadota bacterium]
MPNEYAALKARKKELEKDNRRLAKQIRANEKEIQDIDKVMGPVEELAKKMAPQKTNVSGGGSSGRSRGGPKPAVVLSEVEHILENAEHPMSRSELLEILVNKGFEFRSTNPANALGTAIKRAKETFVSIPKFGYWLARRDYPAGNHYAATYQPAEDNEIELEPLH